MSQIRWFKTLSKIVLNYNIWCKNIWVKNVWVKKVWVTTYESNNIWVKIIWVNISEAKHSESKLSESNCLSYNLWFNTSESKLWVKCLRQNPESQSLRQTLSQNYNLTQKKLLFFDWDMLTQTFLIQILLTYMFFAQTFWTQIF